MKFKSLIITALAAALSWTQATQLANAQATILPPGETCFSALGPTSGGPANTGTGFIGLLGTITGGTGGTNATYGGVALTGGSGTNATANITVSGGKVTQVAILNPGQQYVVGDVLSAASGNIGGVTGFSVPISSVTINYALAGGSVGFYIPTTLTTKQTWQDAGESSLNQNPVPLDQNGCAVIYGAGIYRMILFDSFGNTVYDKLTASTGPAGLFWAGTAGGTGNAITVTDSNFALQDGATIQFRAHLANTGSTTITVSGGSPILVVKDTSTGPAPLSGGEIAASNTPMVTYDAVNAEFHIVNPASTSGGSTGSASLTPPQGYLNLVGAASGNVIQTGDVIGVSNIFYSPLVGNTLPIWNGTTFVSTTFSELTAVLEAAGSPSSTAQDVCVFNNNGVPTLAIGPSWTTVTNRGTGAGTAQLTRLQGIWVNANAITGYNGLSSFSISANQCTYVASLSIDATAAQVSAYRSYGQSRKNGFWNAYNRQAIVMQAGDATSSWTVGGGGSGVFHPINGNTANSIQVFVGLQEEPFSISSFLRATNSQAANTTSQFFSGIGFNSTSTASGVTGTWNYALGSGVAGTFVWTESVAGNFQAGATFGVSTVTALEAFAGGAPAATGGIASNMLTVSYRG